MLKNEIAVGILFFIGMSILGYFTIIMKDEVIDTKTYHEVRADFPFVNGLQKGEKVKMYGVTVGSVTSIAIEGDHVSVRFKLISNSLFYENYALRIRQESIMMGRYLDVYPGTALSGKRVNKPIELKTALRGTAPTDVMVLLEDMLSENRSDLRMSMSNLKDMSGSLKEVTAKINNGQGTLGKLVNEDQTQDAKALIQEVRDTVEDAREQAPITSFIRTVLTIL
jgi:phospholipid/cholesterol/gamma-HCH transport system substrate-binding protein